MLIFLLFWLFQLFFTIISVYCLRQLYITRSSGFNKTLLSEQTTDIVIFLRTYIWHPHEERAFISTKSAWFFVVILWTRPPITFNARSAYAHIVYSVWCVDPPDARVMLRENGSARVSQPCALCGSRFRLHNIQCAPGVPSQHNANTHIRRRMRCKTPGLSILRVMYLFCVDSRIMYDVKIQWNRMR